MALKILLADDSLTAQNMGKKILTEAGYEVIAVSNGAQAIKKIVSENPDLVVLDVYMPGYSGLELCERMRSSRETATTPVVLSVGKMEAFKPEEGNRVRADGLIVKPFEATELLAVVKKLAENVSPAPRPKRPPEPRPVSVVEHAPSATGPAHAEPEFEIQHQSVEIPQDVASTPVAGIELISEEVQEAPQAKQPAAPIEFEVEQAAAHVELNPGPRMSSADGLSGVFEVEPSAPPAVEPVPAPAPVEVESFSPPAEAPAEFQEAHAPFEDSIPTTVEHDFVAAPPEAHDRGAGSEFTAAPLVESSAPPAAGPPSAVEFPQERFDAGQPEADVGSATAQAPGVLPELTSWDNPVMATAPEIPHLSAPSALNSSEPEFAPAAPVWIAEEAEIEPHEFAIPLHQQMQRPAMVMEGPESAAVASVESANVEVFLPPAPSPPPNSVADPAPTRELEDCVPANSELEPQVTVPLVTEAAVEPARVARIVDQVLERLKPELIAAVTRELEKNQ